MKELLVSFWDKLRTIQGAVIIRWGSAIIVVFVWLLPYMQVAAENAVLKIFKDSDEFKQVQDDVGAVKQSLNNINNTLTINNARASDVRDDQVELKKQIDRLVDFIINKKVENVSP